MSNNKPHILVIEDSVIHAQLVKAEIQHEFEDSVIITIVESIREARNTFLKASIDIVILDLMLPDSSGYETILAIQNLDASVPIIVMTGITDEKIKMFALMSGVVQYIIKGEPTNWPNLILSVIDNKRKDSHKLNEITKRIEALTSSTQLVVESIAKMNIFLFGNCTQKSKDESVVNKINVIHSKLEEQGATINIIHKVFWIALPIAITAVIAIMSYSLFGVK